MPVGSSLRISSSVVVQGRTEEKTCCSRMRRAMSCVYWPPKSRTTTPPRSELGRSLCCRIWTLLDIVPHFIDAKNQIRKSDHSILPNLNLQAQTAGLSYIFRCLRHDK